MLTCKWADKKYYIMATDMEFPFSHTPLIPLLWTQQTPGVANIKWSPAPIIGIESTSTYLGERPIPLPRCNSDLQIIKLWEQNMTMSITPNLTRLLISSQSHTKNSFGPLLMNDNWWPKQHSDQQMMQPTQWPGPSLQQWLYGEHSGCTYLGSLRRCKLQ